MCVYICVINLYIHLYVHVTMKTMCHRRGLVEILLGGILTIQSFCNAEDKIQ